MNVLIESANGRVVTQVGDFIYHQYLKLTLTVLVTAIDALGHFETG